MPRRNPLGGGAGLPAAGARRPGMKVELRGLELYGYHGVHDYEREQGQRFLYDVELEVGERGADDRIEHAVDYSQVAAAVREVAAEPRRLLEAVATAVAAAVDERFAPE